MNSQNEFTFTFLLKLPGNFEIKTILKLLGNFENEFTFTFLLKLSTNFEIKSILKLFVTKLKQTFS
jgi:hypothetical protein